MHSGYTYMSWSNYNSKEHEQAGGEYLAVEDAHRKDYISINLSGLGAEAGKEFSVHCGFSEADVHGYLSAESSA